MLQPMLLLAVIHSENEPQIIRMSGSMLEIRMSTSHNSQADQQAIMDDWLRNTQNS